MPLVVLRPVRAEVLDLTTAELTSELFDGIAKAGPARLTTAGRLATCTCSCT